MRTGPLAFTLALAFVARPLRATDGEAERPVVHADTLIRGVPVPSAFKGEGGRTYPPGAYDVSVRQSPQGILIGLVRNGKPVAEVKGRYFTGVVNRFSAGGHAASIHFDASSRVSFAGGGAGKISCSHDLHPGATNLGSISFLLPHRERRQPARRRSPMNARVLAAAALLLGSAAARAQLTCTPTHLRAGSELRIGSPGAFGGSPSADVVLTYRRTAGGAAARFGSPRSWSTREVAFLLPSDLATGTYEVVLSSPAGALRNPSCFTIDPVIVAAPVERVVVGGVAHPTLDGAIDGDLPCPGTTTINLSGKRLSPGTEAAGVYSSDWSPGKTAIEIGGEGPVAPLPPSRPPGAPRLVIRDATHMELTVSRCMLLIRGLKVRAWFPDGTKSAWQTVWTEWNHPGAGGGPIELSR